MADRSHNGTARQIPGNLGELGLNVRAFIDTPPKGQSLEEEVRALVRGIASGKVNPTEGELCVLKLIGREQAEFERDLLKSI